jgi:cell wall-associated NlpC family hydrolase
MAGGKRPVPQCSHSNPENIQDGTTCLAQSPIPGPLGTAMKAFAGWLFPPHHAKTEILGSLKIAGEGSVRENIVTAAKNAAKAAAGKDYLVGGRTPNGFDCSGFVSYAYQSVFPSYQHLDTKHIEAAGSPFEATKSPKSGDLIFFPSGKNPYETGKSKDKVWPAHVGIVVDSAHWISSQSSTGAAMVPMGNPWWNARTKKFFRYKPMTD